MGRKVKRDKLTKEEEKKIIELVENGLPQTTTAKRFGVSASTVNKLVNNKKEG